MGSTLRFDSAKTILEGEEEGGESGVDENDEDTESVFTHTAAASAALLERREALREKVRNVGRVLSLFSAMRKENEMMLKLGSLAPSMAVAGGGGGGGIDDDDGVGNEGIGGVERLLEGKERLRAVLEDEKKLDVNDVKELDKIAEKNSFAVAKTKTLAKSAAKTAAKNAARNSAKAKTSA